MLLRVEWRMPEQPCTRASPLPSLDAIPVAAAHQSTVTASPTTAKLARGDRK